MKPWSKISEQCRAIGVGDVVFTPDVHVGTFGVGITVVGFTVSDVLAGTLSLHVVVTSVLLNVSMLVGAVVGFTVVDVVAWS